MENISWVVNPIVWVTAAVAVVGGLIKFGMWAGAVNSDRRRYDDLLIYIRDRIDTILDRLPNPLIERASPLRLTQLGKEISNKAHALAWANRNLEQAKQRTDGKSPYEIQEHCFDEAKPENLTGEERNAVEAAAFDHGLKVSEILDVFAIELRDLLLTPNQVEDLPSPTRQ